MAKYNQTPRIIVSINNDNVLCKGYYIDNNERIQSFNRNYNTEIEALDYLNNIRDSAEFSIQINRINWKSEV